MCLKPRSSTCKSFLLFLHNLIHADVFCCSPFTITLFLVVLLFTDYSRRIGCYEFLLFLLQLSPLVWLHHLRYYYTLASNAFTTKQEGGGGTGLFCSLAFSVLIHITAEQSVVWSGVLQLGSMSGQQNLA